MSDVWTFHYFETVSPSLSFLSPSLSLSLSFTADCLQLWSFQAHYTCARSSNSITSRLSVTSLKWVSDYQFPECLAESWTTNGCCPLIGSKDAWWKQTHHTESRTPYYFPQHSDFGLWSKGVNLSVWTYEASHFDFLPFSSHAHGVALINWFEFCSDIYGPQRLTLVIPWLFIYHHHKVNILPLSNSWFITLTNELTGKVMKTASLLLISKCQHANNLNYNGEHELPLYLVNFSMFALSFENASMAWAFSTKQGCAKEPYRASSLVLPSCLLVFPVARLHPVG